jgi:alkanesulfonate monooxygenase SsuD/methylene tetrahydromethanopterin reductase-like flavin-dependent oxidoreductase (luciferase family)
MTQISLSIEGMEGLTWPLWKRWAHLADDLGIAGLYRSDHFTETQPPDRASLEMVVSLAYLADHTSRVQIGVLVAPLSFRDPVMLARQASHLDDLSEGRMVLGVGAGWLEREHSMFGYPLLDLPGRFARLEEGLQVIHGLLRSDKAFSFDGEYYHLQAARLLPLPQRPGGPNLLVGGGGRRRTPALAARYADIWNATGMAPGEFREASANLDWHLLELGREPQAVRRTISLPCFYYADQQGKERHLRLVRRWDPGLASLADDEVYEILGSEWNAIAGPAETVIEQLRAYQNAGAGEIMLQWFEMDDFSTAKALSREVIARL